MERHEIFEMMRALKLAGMRAVYDETRIRRRLTEVPTD